VKETGEPNYSVGFINFSSNYQQFTIKTFNTHYLHYPHIGASMLYTNNDIYVIGGNSLNKSEVIKLGTAADI